LSLSSPHESAGNRLAFTPGELSGYDFFYLSVEARTMNKINLSISITTLGLVAFVVLCSLSLSIVFLQLYLFGLTGCLIWMVITILKNGEPSSHTFEDRFYEDADLGPHSSHD
jgi:hypothetical protein